MRVVLTHHFADDISRLGELGSRSPAITLHGVENTAVNRLQPVSYIGQSSVNDH